MPVQRKARQRATFYYPIDLEGKYNMTEDIFFSDGNSCLHENFNCYQNFKGVAGKGS